MNSDDDLSRETILSPLMPATTIDTVLEKANVAYENESQQECEDILDSVHDCYFEELDRKTSQCISNDHSWRSSSSMMIPQLDGSNDHPSPFSFVNESSGTHKKTWVESSMIVECSTRDLMRVKRSYQAEPPEYGNHIKKVQLGAKGKEDSFLYAESSHDEKEKMPLDSLISRSAITDQPRECHERNSCLALQMQAEPGDIKADKSNCPSYSKFPLSSSSLLENASKDGVFLSSEGPHVEVVSRASVSLQNYGRSGASTSQGTKDLFQLTDAENKNLPVYMGSCGCCSRENVDCCVKCTKTSNPDLCTPIFATYSRFTSETDDIFTGCKLLQKNAVGLSQSPVDPSSSISTVTGVSGDFVELIGMTFIKKPPKVEFTDEPGCNAQSACGAPSYHAVNKKNKERSRAHDRGLDECPPFFEGNSLVGEKIYSTNCGTSNDVRCHDNVLGVPVHYQNDGSYLYMLTPVYSPSQSECVRQWLLLDCIDSSKANVVSDPPVYPSTKVCSDDVAETQDSQSTFGDQPLMDPASASEPNPDQLQAKENNQKSNSVQVDPVLPDARRKQQDEEIILKCEPSMRGSQDLSQISGPDRKSRLTPLSQTGFRDPASIGCGQQLTILSIEVQAESRGDLRPDPLFDAVRIVVLIFQEDDLRSNTHVLVHCNGESVQRDLDGVSGCKVLTFSEERQVFVHFIKMINSFDPDILMGWAIQGGSLGFLAERAAYLGIGNIASRDSEGGKLSDIFPEAVAADPMFREDAAIIGDEWGRTHAAIK
ncbi:hypothetical protein K7X08_036340 [Anisodus acutangulus]|uniref:DNA-directed DNA polymerase family B exonuclease domain-containing protein n=1 Tax=Anisodus acutangulus TaxID=402998 RepID=A0A9Q1L6X8_9SOLA|nr:hypothetical protein K7X08_036340 [Anisodus acutangulus]